MNRRIRDLEHELSQVGDGGEAQHHEILQLQQSLSDRDQDLEQARAQAQELHQKIAELESTHGEHDQHSIRLQGDLEAVAEELGVAQSDIERLNQELKQAIADREVAESLNSMGQDAARQAGDELGRQSKLIEQLSAEKEDYNIEVEQLKKQLTRWESELSQQKEDAQSEFTALQDELSDAQREKHVWIQTTRRCKTRSTRSRKPSRLAIKLLRHSRKNFPRRNAKSSSRVSGRQELQDQIDALEETTTNQYKTIRRTSRRAFWSERSETATGVRTRRTTVSNRCRQRQHLQSRANDRSPERRFGPHQ